MVGDGSFFWWMGFGQEPETYSGPYDSRMQAVAQARAEDGETRGFTIVEADKAVASDNVFDAGDILERYEEHNEECWSEDGADIQATGPQRRDLEEMLEGALREWFAKHGNRPRVWSFGTMRNEEYFAPVASTAA